jgi:hypothetical protein
VDYIAQTGDTLPALAARFNTTVPEIFAANPIIPRDATTMPPGLPMKIPIYYRALWANPFHIIPDVAFINGPSLIGFNTSAFVADHPGWLKGYRAYAGGVWRSGAGVVDYIATNYSISPRLLLAILEYQTGALSQAKFPPKYSLGFKRLYYDNPYLTGIMAGAPVTCLSLISRMAACFVPIHGKMQAPWRCNIISPGFTPVTNMHLPPDLPVCFKPMRTYSATHGTTRPCSFPEVSSNPNCCFLSRVGAYGHIPVVRIRAGARANHSPRLTLHHLQSIQVASSPTKSNTRLPSPTASLSVPMWMGSSSISIKTAMSVPDG